jgi:adenylylsulfate kinase
VTSRPQPKPFILWFTGLSGAGKSALAESINTILKQHHIKTRIIDGDVVRQSLCADLSFSDEDRTENISRVSELAKSLFDSGVVVLAAFISPKHLHRQQVRSQFEAGQFIEVYVDTEFDVCESRDIKGLYKKARRGELINFTGIDSSYEAPTTPEIHVKTEKQTIEACTNQLMDYLNNNGYLGK